MRADGEELDHANRVADGEEDPRLHEHQLQNVGTPRADRFQRAVVPRAIDRRRVERDGDDRRADEGRKQRPHPEDETNRRAHEEVALFHRGELVARPHQHFRNPRFEIRLHVAHAIAGRETDRDVRDAIQRVLRHRARVVDVGEHVVVGTVRVHALEESRDDAGVIAGFFQGMDPHSPYYYMFANIDDARAMTEYPLDRVTYIAIGLSPGYRVRDVKAN